jgi:membrane fusion protein (multidrug efflux system)
LQAVDPIYVDFKLPQQQLALISNGQTVNVTTDAFPGVKFIGKVNAIDPRVDPSTRNFQAEATVPNSNEKLLPGMFARVAVQSGKPNQYLTLPQTAITYNPYGATVFVARKRSDGTKEDLIAEQRFVTLGPTRGDQVAILKGVEKDDMVVTSGQLKLVNGAVLKVDNTVLPSNDPHPTPQEN